MPHQSPHLSHVPSTAPQRRLRFDRIMHLDSTDMVAATAISDKDFAERAAFGPAAEDSQTACPAHFLSETLKTVAAGATTVGLTERPIHIPAPMPALAHENTALFCDAAVRQTRFCAQEFVFEFKDAALHASRTDLLEHVQNLRKRGFRVSLDARRSFETKLCGNLRLMLDTIRVEADAVWSDPALQEKIEIAAESGIGVIAQNARYRDSEALIRLGVTYGAGLKADA